MLKKQWKNKIKKACRDAGTYQKFFDPVIDSLAAIMELRDKAQENFETTGGNAVVVHTNKSGAKNIVKNPALTVMMECNIQALNYWRELGLTSKSYKTLAGQLSINVEARGIEDALADLGI